MKFEKFWTHQWCEIFLTVTNNFVSYHSGINHGVRAQAHEHDPSLSLWCIPRLSQAQACEQKVVASDGSSVAGDSVFHRCTVMAYQFDQRNPGINRVLANIKK